MVHFTSTARAAALGLAFVLTMASACLASADSVVERSVMTERKQQVVDLLKAIATGASGPVAVINPDKYIQHNLGAVDGLSGFKALLRAVPKGASVKTVRVFQDGGYVFAHTEYDVFGPMIGFDIFRFENGKIVEHWDNLQANAGPNASGRSMIDGPTEPQDLDRTEANKALARSFVEDVLVNGQTNKLSRYSDDLQGQTKTAAGVTRKYERIHMVLGEGNFVLAVSEGRVSDQPTAFYDLFRIENNKIAEHWNVAETIPPRSEWKNDNGKF